jgi:hypothetical protein
VRRVSSSLVFPVVAVLVVWAAPAGNVATTVARVDAVTMVLVLAGLPLLVRRLAGPVAVGRTARILRLGGYAAVLVLTVAKASVEQVADAPAAVPHLNSDATVPALTGMPFTWIFESLFLVIVAGYVAAILTLTAQRSRVAPATLAAGTAAGIVIGVVLYALVPLGLSKQATSPWLSGAAITPVVVLAWIVLFAAPMAAGLVAARRCSGSGGLFPLTKAATRQAIAAGLFAGLVGALFVTVLGTGTIALMPRVSWLLHWLYLGQHLRAAVAYNRELTASANAVGYFLILLAFPIIGFAMGAWPASFSRQPGLPPGGDGHHARSGRWLANRAASTRRRIVSCSSTITRRPGLNSLAAMIVRRAGARRARTGPRGSAPTVR